MQPRLSGLNFPSHEKSMSYAHGFNAETFEERFRLEHHQRHIARQLVAAAV
jgi:hypothetical protein